MSQRVCLRCKLKSRKRRRRSESKCESAFSSADKTRNRVSYPWPGWTLGKTKGRPEPTCRATHGDELWIGEKFQSNSVIAGSPRNSLRASVEFIFPGVEHWMGTGEQSYLPQSNSEYRNRMSAVRLWGLSSISLKGNSPWPLFKVPKSRLSVKGGEMTYTTRRLA